MFTKYSKLTKNALFDIMYLPVTTRAYSKGGDVVEIILAFLISVTAGLFVELICRWLDGKQ